MKPNLSKYVKESSISRKKKRYTNLWLEFIFLTDVHLQFIFPQSHQFQLVKIINFFLFESIGDNLILCTKFLISNLIIV